MANREELGLIRGARAGHAQAQLALGRRYLFGGAGLPRSLPTALHWLARAARQDCAEASLLIGQHIPFALAQEHARDLAPCYAQAYDAGAPRAGLVLAQLVPGQPDALAADAALRAKAGAALQAAVGVGGVDAQGLLTRHDGPRQPLPPPAAAWRSRDGDSARCGVLDAAWEAQQWQAYLQRALPLARARARAAASNGGPPLTASEAQLLSRCARALARVVPGEAELAHRFCELAARAHDRHAQMALGLDFARMRADGQRIAGSKGSANFKKAIRWLTLAGEQGLAAAWYALARIYMKPEFSQRNVAEAQRYLERAADMGHRDAQHACGTAAWRARRDAADNDVRAVFWLQKAATQGCTASAAALRRIAPRAPAALLAPDFAPARALSISHPLLAARLELAAAFGLNRAETLLIELAQADRGHCLLVDIRRCYSRNKRRIVLVETGRQRQLLDRLARVFDGVDMGPAGPEGNYRQRLYRLKTVLPDAGAPLEMAA